MQALRSGRHGPSAGGPGILATHGSSTNDRPERDNGTPQRDLLRRQASYVDRVATLDTYRTIRQRLDSVLHNSDRVIDIGNGGTFDYDSTTVAVHRDQVDCRLE